MFKNNTFLNRFLLEFSSLWPPKMEGKFNVFGTFIQKADFVKIIVFSNRKLLFVWFWASKIGANFDVKFRSKITSEKKLSKRIWASILVSPNYPNFFQKAMLNEACFATLWKPPRSRQKLTGLIAFGPPIWLRI